MTELVLCIVFRKTEDGPEFLLLKRVPDKGAFWQPVGGVVEEHDETLVDAGYREVMEETGIREKDILNVIKDAHYFEFNEHYLTGEPIPTQKLYSFGFEVVPEVAVHIHDNQDKEREEYGWFTYEEAVKKLKWDNNKEAFEKLRVRI